jgi:hypothetical protein
LLKSAGKLNTANAQAIATRDTIFLPWPPKKERHTIDAKSRERVEARIGNPGGMTRGKEKPERECIDRVIILSQESTYFLSSETDEDGNAKQYQNL